VRASVWLTGLTLLVGGYAVLLLAAQSAIGGAAPADPPAGGRSLALPWVGSLRGEPTAPAAGTGAGIRFNQDSTGSRVSIGLPADSDYPTVPALLSTLPAEIAARSGAHAGLAAGLTWIIGVSAVAALLRRA
jgi:hypothetical protein